MYHINDYIAPTNNSNSSENVNEKNKGVAKCEE